MKDISSQSHRRHRVHGLVRGTDDLVPAVIWIIDSPASPPRAPMAGCNRASDCRMDCSSTHQGIRLEADTTIPHSRSGWGLWRRFDPPSSCDGHPGSSSRTAITMAKLDIPRGSSARSDGTALIMSWCSTSGTFATCWDRTKNITMTLAHTYRSTRMHQRCALFRPLAASWPTRISEGCTINTSGFDFR
jgi:hypothetical protein